jgi:Domain of unknown function (DUF1929)
MAGVRGRRLGLMVLAAAMAVGASACGSWEVSSKPSPVPAIHVALLHTGKVLLVAGSGNDKAAFDAGTFRTSVWDPTSNTFSTVSTPWDAFCAGHAFLPDGRLLVTGGTTAYQTTGSNFAGSRRAFLFDPGQNRYEAVPGSKVARWYPTVVELGDGGLFTLGGLNENRVRTRNYEIFDGTSWSASVPPPGNVGNTMPTYPALHLLDDGRLFYSGANVLGTGTMDPGIWNLGSNTYQKVPGLTKQRLRDESMSVLLPPAQDQRVMILGGGVTNSTTATATDAVAVADLKNGSPRYSAAPPLDAPKMYVSAVVLPDSTVLETGGGSKSVNAGSFPVLSAQIFDPKTDSWTKAASPTVPRLYHSSAILLPDGRVATFGGNPKNSFEMRIEIYSPEYLRKDTPRPGITSGPAEMHYGGSYSLETTQASPLTSAVLVRPAAVTHSSDSNQRLVDLGLTSTASGIRVTVPGNRNLTPPGWYMLFVNDANGVPSVAKWVHVT